MSIAQLEALYALASRAEVLRTVIDDEPVDAFTLVSRKLEAFLGPAAHDEPWFSALAPIRRARWLVHTVPLPTDHAGLALGQLAAETARGTTRLAAGGSDELRHWFGETAGALQRLVDEPAGALAAAVVEMLEDGADPTATVVLMNMAHCRPVQDFLAGRELPVAAVLPPASLRDRPAHASQLIIGASKIFPDWLFTAPRAELITVVQRASARDRDEVPSMLPSGGMKPRRIAGARSARLHPAAFVVEPPPVNWSNLRPDEERDRPDSVRARALLLADNHTVLLEASDGATVFTVHPQAAAGEIISRVPTSTVEPGDYLLLRSDFGAEDVIVQLADKVLGGRAFTLRGQQAHWKNALRQAVHRDGARTAERRLHELGCTANNLGRWLSADGIRTQRQQDFRAICLYSGLTEATAMTLWQAMGEIRSAHVRAGQQLRELLERQLEKTDLDPLHAHGRLAVHLPDVDAGALVIYRVDAKDESTLMVHPRRLRVATPAGQL